MNDAAITEIVGTTFSDNTAGEVSFNSFFFSSFFSSLATSSLSFFSFLSFLSFGYLLFFLNFVFQTGAAINMANSKIDKIDGAEFKRNGGDAEVSNFLLFSSSFLLLFFSSLFSSLLFSSCSLLLFFFLTSGRTEQGYI